MNIAGPQLHHPERHARTDENMTMTARTDIGIDGRQVLIFGKQLPCAGTATKNSGSD
jgi:hypothetical protein